MHQAVNRVARLVVRPFFVDILIDPRKRAQHLASATVEPDVGADSVHHVDRRRLLQFPGPCFESVRLGRQRTHRAEIDDIARKFARHRAFEVGGDLHILAAADRADFLDSGHFLRKADAARALDAAGHHCLDDRAHVFLGDGALVLVIA